MEFQLMRINPGKLLLLVLAGSTGGVLVILGLPLLDNYGSFGAASVATFLFFGGGWLFNKGLHATQEPLLITVSDTELAELNQCSGQQRRWPFAEIFAYQRLPQVRGTNTLRLTLRGGRRAQLIASSLSLGPALGSVQFDLMEQAFARAWHQHN